MTRIVTILTAVLVVLLGVSAPAQAAPNWDRPPDVHSVASVSGNDRVGYALRMDTGSLVYVAAPRVQYRECLASNSPQWCANVWATFYAQLDQIIYGAVHTPCVAGGSGKWAGFHCA